MMTDPQAVVQGLSRAAQGASAGISVRSVLNPLLKLCAIVTPMCFVAAWIFRDSSAMLVFLTVTGTIPIYFACIAYAYFAKSDPARLQSEEYQLRHQSIKMIQIKSESVAADPSILAQLAAAPLSRLIDQGESAPKQLAAGEDEA